MQPHAAMTGQTRPVDAALQTLISLAGELHDCLAAGEWEGVVVQQGAYDETFAKFLALADRGDSVSPELRPLLRSLSAMHDENLRLARELQASARTQLGEVRTQRRLGEAYSPLGANHTPGPRFIDNAA